MQRCPNEVFFQLISALQRKLLITGFLDAQVLQLKSFLQLENIQYFTVNTGFWCINTYNLSLHHKCILLFRHRIWFSPFFSQIKAKKPSWEMGSSFSIKKATKSLPKVQIDDDSDLIDEDSLLTDEDLKKPQLPLGQFSNPIFYLLCAQLFWGDLTGKSFSVVGDCEVDSTRKACKNCTCGRAEAEEKVQKLELTAELLNNPQSACGSVCIS